MSQILAGSTKAAPREFDSLPPFPGGETISVTIRLRRKNHLSKWADTTITQRQFTLRHGSERADVEAIKAFAAANRLTVERARLGHREAVLKGTAADMQKAFGVELRARRVGKEIRRVRSGHISVPKSLAEVITSVTGLDNRPFAKPHFRIAAHAAMEAAAGTAVAPAPAAAYTPAEIASFYNFPQNLDGTGQSIAILELGGGFRQEELTAYFQDLGIPAPSTTVVSFAGGGENNPGVNACDPFCRDAEVMLDLQVAGAVAPGAKLLVYFAADDSDQSFLSAFSAIIHDSVNKPNIVSISWGAPEKAATQQFREEFDQLLQSAAHLGITVCAATGDNASADYPPDDPEWDNEAHVDLPAASPWALACGGTRIATAGSAITREELWFDGPNDGAGGGISRFFPIPDFQRHLNIPSRLQPSGPAMRGIPDVCAVAAPSSGYKILCNGQKFPDPENGVAAMGGTSAVAPLWAGLIARINQSIGRPCGYINPTLYSIAATPGQKVFREIVSGSNGTYMAGPGWNPCAGLGSVDGTRLLEALKKRRRK